MMPMTDDQQTIRYITERRCASGGYCFYRLEEPNAGDTFHALASLAMLGEVPDDDDATRSYLHSFQHNDGGFANVNVGHAVCRALGILGEKPRADPTGWILSLLLPPGDSARPVESSSLFGNTYLLADLCLRLGIAVPPDKKDVLISAVLGYQHKDTGFGSPYSTIIETSHALAILAVLGYPVPMTGSTEFVKHCEDLSFGFLAVPGVTPAYLEHVHAGVHACSVLGYRSPAHGTCRDFISRCLLGNGGYTRSVYGGSATLENTYLALAARAMIDRIAGSERTDPLRCCD